MSASDIRQQAEAAEIVASVDFWANPHLHYSEKGNLKPPDIPALAWWLAHPDMGLSHVRFNRLEGAIDAEMLPWDAEKHTWRDADTSYLLLDLQQRIGGVEVAEGKVLHALVTLAHDRSYDPLLDTLDKLPDWDRAPRADTLFVDYLGARDSAYTRAVTRHMLNGAVMRAYVPGIKFDDVVVLSSKRQGIGKSTLIRKLALHDDFFTDSVGNIATKDAAEVLQGKWIVEIGELEAVRKRDIETVKIFIAKRDDRYRAAYGKFAETRKRRCIFIGSTNSTAFLSDRTGNRRFFPIECDVQPPTLDVFSDGAAEYIQQVWAEVLQDYHDNGTLPLVLPDEIKQKADRVTESFTVDDSKDGLIAAWVDGLRPGSRICILQVLHEVFDIGRSDATKPMNKALSNEISQILDLNPKLHRLDGRPKHSKAYGQQRCWEYHPDD